MTLLIDILVEVGTIMGIGTIDKPGTADWPCVALQVFYEKESLLVVVVLENEAWWKEMEIRQVVLIVGDIADLETAELGGKLLILSCKGLNSLS